MGRRRKLSTNMQCLITALGFLLLAWLFFPASTDEEAAEGSEVIVEETPPMCGAVNVDIVF